MVCSPAGPFLSSVVMVLGKEMVKPRTHTQEGGRRKDFLCQRRRDTAVAVIRLVELEEISYERRSDMQY